ncbi:hypothetical protein GGS24DRAFT_497471 [Hypoxylon argillaceum]|nr:hypothetical protein GGS24DRAFT_497471 [Hypoxylon argillaceum]
MGYIVKVWLATLNDGHSIVETAFSGLWSETMMTAAASSDGPGHHGLFQCEDDPNLLAVVLGYRSRQASETVQREISDKLPRIRAWLTHKELFLMDLNVKALPLHTGKLAILFADAKPEDADSLPGKGEWAASEPSMLTSHLPVDPSVPKKMTWVHVALAEDADRLRPLGLVQRFTMIMESRIDSHAAE